MYTRGHKDIRGRVDWNSYNDHVQGKSRQQCKSYFTNVVRIQTRDLKQVVTEEDTHLADMILELMRVGGDRAKLRANHPEMDEESFA